MQNISKSKRDMVFISIIVGLVAILISGMVIMITMLNKSDEPANTGTGTNLENSQYLANIDGYMMTLDEFYVYLYQYKTYYESVVGTDIWDMEIDGITADEKAKQTTFRYLLHIKATKQMAEQMGIGLTEEEWANVAETAKTYTVPAICDPSVMTDELFTDILGEMTLYSIVMDKQTENYVVEDEDFEAFFAAYLERTKDDVPFDEMEEDEKQIVKDQIRVEYTQVVKEDIFTSMCDSWAEGMVVTRNPDLWDAISVKDLDE